MFLHVFFALETFAGSVEEQSSAGPFQKTAGRIYIAVLGFPKELCVKVNPDLVKTIFWGI